MKDKKDWGPADYYINGQVWAVLFMLIIFISYLLYAVVKNLG